METFKKYPKHSSYEIGTNSTIKYNGKIIRDSTNAKPIFINGELLPVERIVQETYKTDSIPPAKQKIPKQKSSKLLHGNTGRKHTETAKQRMRDNRGKTGVNIDGIQYGSITEASLKLGVNRTTIYRRTKKP